MSRYGKLITIVFFIAIAGSCTPLKVQHDYDTEYDFTKLKTYDWVTASQGSEKEELLMRRVEQSVNSQLLAKGYSRSANAPDFVVSVEGVRTTVTKGSVGIGASVAVPVGSHGAVSLGLGRSRPRTRVEGQLTVEIREAASQALIWEGSAAGAVRASSTPEEQQQRLNAVVGEILKKFPPGNTQEGQRSIR